MSKLLLLPVMGQARYVHAVHSFICELLTETMPGLARGNTYIRNSTDFCKRIDCAIRDASTPDATEGGYVRAIVDEACREMAPLCGLLKAASSLAGLEKVANDYLDAKRFREMLLRKDEEKLERLVAIVRAREGKPIKTLMDVAKVLNDSAQPYDGMDAAAKRKAARDMTKLIGKVEEMRSAMDAHKDEIVSHVDEVGAKVDKIRLKGKRKSKYTDAQREVCDTCWNAAQRNAEVRHSVNTRVTYEAVFEHSRRELSEVGVRTIKDFRKILHAVQSRECDARKRELEAKIEAARKKKSVVSRQSLVVSAKRETRNTKQPRSNPQPATRNPQRATRNPQHESVV